MAAHAIQLDNRRRPDNGEVTLNDGGVTAAEAAVKMLHAHSVDTIFCLPGVQNDFFFNALYDHNQSAPDPIRIVHTRHEQGAAYMALGYALGSGDVGVLARKRVV